MLQPRRFAVLFWGFFVFVDCLKGQDYINTSPRQRRQNDKDVTTVLLVGNSGRPSFGRFLSVKPDLGLITSTARTFIQEGVTTEYATQVLGTTLDNGRLYAHLLTKSSRVLYDDAPSQVHDQLAKKKWNLDENLINAKHFIKNTDYIAPTRADAVLVYPTEGPVYPVETNGQAEEKTKTPQVIVEDEILKESPTNNFRALYDENLKKQNVQDNVKVFKISPQMNDLTHENIIAHRKGKEKPLSEEFIPSKVRAWDNLPTFTIRNDFSPSGLSYLGDLPNFDDPNTERSRPTTAAERKAKLLFKAGLSRPNPKDFTSITYTGFADFTTTVGDTVIIFTPNTATTPTEKKGEATSISVKPVLIQPTTALRVPPIATRTHTPSLKLPPKRLKTIEDHKAETKNPLPTMVIDKTDRSREPKSQTIEEHVDMEAKSAVLAHEQGKETAVITSTQPETAFSPDVIQPSETQPVMLSTPSDEDIAKIFASLQAQSAKQATEPLNTPATIFFDDAKDERSTKQHSGEAKTIFFDDDEPIETSVVEVTTPSRIVEEITSTTEEEEATTTHVTTERLQETTERLPTTQKEDITTNEILTTSEDSISTLPVQQTTPEIESDEIHTEKEKGEQEDEDTVCTGHQVLPTTVYKTLTYLTTFFIPLEDDETSTSVKSNEVISTEVGYQTLPCDIDITPSSVVEPLEATDIAKTTTEAVEEEEENNEEEFTEKTSDEIIEEQATEHITNEITTRFQETTPQEITTERRHVTESEPETTETTTDDGDEVELIYKTLYTTYTYLTTYFQDSTSSIASRIVVTTNVITSTLDPSSKSTDPAVAGLLEADDDNVVSSMRSKTVSFEDLADITPSSIIASQPSSQLVKDDEEADGEDDTDSANPTPVLENPPNGVKTYYTTYTYFTTIFVDGETEISSRTEVYTNYITPTIQPTASGAEILPTEIVKDQLGSPNEDDDDDNEEEFRQKILSLNISPQNSYNTINRYKTATVDDDDDDREEDVYNNVIAATPTIKEQAYITLQRSGTTTEDNEISENNILNLNEYDTISTMVTDVRSSTSEGDRRIIENVDKRNVLVDDQIVSESNNDSEIIPSPTLLVQTSYTTFTYFTTMYHGTTSSDIVSRLETVTNVVTQTLTPTPTLTVEDLSLPVTYFTTFTYWTTLYKDNTTRVTSREETVSNVVTPSISATASPSISITPIVTTPLDEDISPTETADNIVPSTVGDDDLTTYFTTYTYFTTSYIGNSTVLNSRLETVTNVLNNSRDIDSNQITTTDSPTEKNQADEASKKPKIEPTRSSTSLKPTGLLSTTLKTEVNHGTTTVHSTDIYGTYIDGLYAKVLESTSSILKEAIAPSSVTANLKPTGVVSINHGKIVDAEGVSTLFYTTQAVGTYIDGLYAQVIESTSSLAVDETKKSALPATLPIAQRTGLVRVVDGSIIQNGTTTFYVSKVLGTNIDGKYAQIIESTSSFLVGPQATVKPSAVVNEIVPSPTQAPDQKIVATDTISPSPVVIEGSISDSAKPDDETSTEENGGGEEEEDEDKDNSRVKSRLTFQSRKRTFTPAIRPFASRQRPTFAPKRKQSGQSTAATITRTDFTPTVTAVPASKSNRFGAKRSSTNPQAIQPTASGRRFARPKSTGAIGTSSRRGSSARIQPTASGFGASSRRTGGFRASSAGGAIRPSSLFGARPRIRPTIASGLSRSPSSQVTQASIADENDLTTIVTDNPTDGEIEDAETTLTLQTTTEAASRRSQNPLLKFRRPPLARPTQPSRTTAGRTTKNGNLNNKKASSTTPKPKVAYNRPNSLLNRPRPNALFPRRGLFTTTTTPPPEEEVEEEEADDLEEEGDIEEDTDYDSSLTNTQTATPPTTPDTKRAGRSNTVQIKPFFRRRTRRDTYSRFRRPTPKTTAAPVSQEPETEAPPKQTGRGRFSPKHRGKSVTTTSAPTTRKRISPSKASAQSRSQFTLREKDTTSTRSNFKRPKSSTRTTRPTAASRPKAPRLRNNLQTEASARKAGGIPRQTSRSNGSSRSRTQNVRARYQKEETPEVDNFDIPQFDGTITVTHQIPTEVTIPVVNGKITEYKNVVSASYSTEVLDPRQYSRSINALGKEVTVLINENTVVGSNGATLITQFVLNEKPTTTVIFTPTYINRRKTSFSHVIPSTVYDVEQVVNTIQPALAAQAPLANILLSQLLLGGLQPHANPLLGLQQPGLAPPTPTTEFKTITTSYVTTVTSQTSTVIPLTFRGKEILTTIIDSSTSVITATEFITETVVVTPTLGFPIAPQFNTALLLPLLQQQLQQANNNNPLLQNTVGLNEPLPPQSLLPETDQYNLAIDDSSELQVAEESTPAPRRKSARKNKKSKPSPITPPKETSIVTLYVSGRTPGEFTTVLSTVTIDETNGRKKRDVSYIPVSPSVIVKDVETKTDDTYDSYVMPTTKGVRLEGSEVSKETESLESIIGDVTRHLTTQMPELFNIKPTKSSSASKKYKINVNDLSKVAPLMPKVETSLTNIRGQFSSTQTNQNKNVSNNNGQGDIVDSNFNLKNSDPRLSVRHRRDLEEDDDEIIELPRRKKRIRVRKKLVRVEPINNKINIDTSTEYAESDVTTKRARRKLLIKKKKKKRLLNPINNTNGDSEEHIEQATKPRRKIIITRKRLVPNNSETIDASLSTFIDTTAATITTSDITTSPALTDNPDMMDEATTVDAEEYTTENNIDEITTENINDGEDNYVENFVGTPTTDEYDDETYREDTNTLDDGDNDGDYNSEENHVEENATEEDMPENIDNEEDYTETNDQPTFQSIPDYEPDFPELTKSLDAPVLILKTTILSSTELLTKTVTQSRLRTYTFVVTRVHDNEQIVTSTTEVKPQIKTTVVTEPTTLYTTLTLLDFDATQTMTEIPDTIIPTLDNPQPQLVNQDVGRGHDEARYNLATRVMSNGVEVIVAGDKSTLPGDPDFKRLLTSNSYKPVTLKPSTLLDQMMMMLPQDSSNIASLTSSLVPNQFVTKTCLTTFTYLTTYLEGDTTTVSSHEQVVSNIATEERNTGKILPTPAMGITLTQNPNLSVGVFHTTYTYLNTILDGEQPLVVSSKHTVTNTVTAPDDYLSFLKPSETVSAIKDTNTYYSTVPLEKTIYEGGISSVIRTDEVVTQVVITESVPPRATSVMTSYIALDVEDPMSSPQMSYTTTDVVKTYFVTYTYYNTVMANGTPLVNTNVSTSSDVVTEKLYLYPKKTTSHTTHTASVIGDDKKKHKIDLSPENFQILATKTYFTTFTYFTTLLQEQNMKNPTVVRSRTSVVQNIVTETVDPNLLDKKNLNIIKNELKNGSNSITKIATLQDGQKLEITAIADENKDKIKPTKVLPIEKTKDPEITITTEKSTVESSSTSPSVITGSTIIFVDDDPFAQLAATPTLAKSSTTIPLKNNLAQSLSSEIIKETKASTSANKSKRSTKTKVSTASAVVGATKTKTSGEQTTFRPQNNSPPTKGKPQNDKKKQTGDAKIPKPAAAASDLLGLGSININSLQALTPVLNAMAGLIKTNLNTNRRNDPNITTTTPKSNSNHKLDKDVPTTDIQNRSPIYIPVGGLADDFEIAESQNIATFDWVDSPPKIHILNKAPQEASLLNGGIPISPGDVITANSDVIVGKPGRIGPRIPPIPLNQVKGEDEAPIGMKPPPLPDKIWPKNNHDYNHIPIGNFGNDKPIIHAPNKDDYVGPPPPLYGVKEGVRGDKRKQIPLTPPRKETAPYYNGDAPHIYSPQNQNNYGALYAINEVNHDINLPNLQESIQKNYDTLSKHSYPMYAYDQASVVVSDIPIDIKPSVINAPMVLPEVIERSTGQPLLVNIQPSQVAFVNIPFNRTTALIYGGSTEPHRNGEYFDDPSPYPEPEFSGIEFNNGLPQLASIYHDEALNQKQVKGVIKVGNQLINVKPSPGDGYGGGSGGHHNIRPTRPHEDAQMAFGTNHEVSINVPPISFGVMQQGNDFNAHVINHGSIEFRPPASAYEVTVEEENLGRPGYQKIPQNFKRNEDNKIPARPNHPQTSDVANDVSRNKLKYPTETKRPRPVRPNIELSEYMIPPPPNKMPTPKRPYPRRPTSQKPLPLPIPLTPPPKYNYNPPYHPQLPIRNDIPLHQLDDDKRNVIIPPNNNHPAYEHNVPSSYIDPDIGDHTDDDLENEEGEVIQESNSRPLLPGEVPFEILKAKTSTTTERIKYGNNVTIRFPSHEQVALPGHNNAVEYHEPPRISQNARPFANDGGGFERPQDYFMETAQTKSNTSHESSSPSGLKNKYLTTDYSVKDGSGTQKHKNSPSGFVVVGSQFEDHGKKKFVVSGTQFTDFNKLPQKVTLLAPKVETTTKSTENTVDHVFGFKNKYPRYTTTTTQKPVIIYIDDKVENKNEFFNKNKVKNDRPSVTSLPIDPQTLNIPTYKNTSYAISTQTEKPFIPKNKYSLPSNEIIIRDIITTKSPSTTTKQTPPSTLTPELNSGEIINVTTELSDMEIMKPPPLEAETPVKLPDTEMQPPKIEIETHGGDILRVPNIQTELPHPSSPRPYIPQHFDNIVPPPETTTIEEVLGMSPPPLESTHRPIVNDKPVTTSKPVFSMAIDNISKKVSIPSSTSSTTQRYRYTRPRRPYTKRPGYRRPTTTPSSTTRTTTIRRPTRPIHIKENSTLTETRSTTERVIIPTPTIKVPPSMEVIIGNPHSKAQEEPATTERIQNKVQLTGSETSLQGSTTEKTAVLDNRPSELLPSGDGPSRYAVHSSESDGTKNIVTLAVHHAGNEVKVVDETSSNIDSSSTPSSTTSQESKIVIPTRYITHTKTSTVTITKTTVVKTLGGPPSTLTILLTKTETSTIVEKVTEFHTLVKPTSVTETITTTVHQGGSLYPADLYGSSYPSIQVKPTTLHLETSTASSTPSFEDLSEEDLSDFIISETDPPISQEKEGELNDSDSILVIMTDKNTKGIVKVPSVSEETVDRDEIITNKVSDILRAGILSAAGPPTRDAEEKKHLDKCTPECKASKNELCQKVGGIMRCVCRPGFARMFPDRPCLPTYTYDLNVTLERIGKDKLHYFEDLARSNSSEFLKFAQATREALDRMVMQSDLRDIFHGVQVHAFEPSAVTKDVVGRFYLQLSDNIDDNRLEDIFRKYLRNNNYSLGGTDIFASASPLEELRAEDFDECSHSKFHDCSEHAQCFNLKGTYTCSCVEGYSDLSENILYPGRICSAEQVGCDRCNYHGTCYSREGDEVICECFQWYAGENCHVNLKVLLIALVTLGAILIILLFICIILTCIRSKPKNAGVASGMSFFPQRVNSSSNRGTLDRRAMIQDTSSEDSRSETNNTLPYTQKVKKPKGALKKTSKVTLQRPSDVENGENTLCFSDQKDRSLTVMIPRAKYHPAPPTSPLMKYTTFDARKPSVPSVNEAKLLSYLDAGPTPNKSDLKRKFSKAPSESFSDEKPSCSRKASGALISAGFEVSATVVNNMGTLGTTCGTEADRSENATLIQKISADLLSSTGTRSQFNTIRKSLVDDDLDSSHNWLDIVPGVTTVSEARSYDETTIPPPMKSFRNDYDSKPSSQHLNDEANTMAERDLGSTFLLPHTHLYKPDRGSDISGFESL